MSYERLGIFCLFHGRIAYTPVSGHSYPQNLRYVDDLELYRKRKTQLNVEQGEVHEVHPSATGGSSKALSTAANLSK